MNPGLCYREAAVAGASPVRLVILLYEQAISDLRRAQAAQAKGDIEGRTREINHATEVIGHLQATVDREQGGKVAVILDRFYEQVRCSLMEAQCKQSVSLLEQGIEHLLQGHEAWCAVESAMASGKPEVGAGTELQPAGLESLMSVLPFNLVAHELHETNQRLRFWLESVGGCPAAGSELRPPTAGEISALLSELMRAGEWLRGRPQETGPELDFELSQYRELVERLRSHLPVMHRALLRERARLEQERERLTAAAQWAHASRQML